MVSELRSERGCMQADGGAVQEKAENVLNRARIAEKNRAFTVVMEEWEEHTTRKGAVKAYATGSAPRPDSLEVHSDSELKEALCADFHVIESKAEVLWTALAKSEEEVVEFADVLVLARRALDDAKSAEQAMLQAMEAEGPVLEGLRGYLEVLKRNAASYAALRSALKRPQDKASSSAQDNSFIQATKYSGAREGYVFKSGNCGLGYYRRGAGDQEEDHPDAVNMSTHEMQYTTMLEKEVVQLQVCPRRIRGIAAIVGAVRMAGADGLGAAGTGQEQVERMGKDLLLSAQALQGAMDKHQLAESMVHFSQQRLELLSRVRKSLETDLGTRHVSPCPLCPVRNHAADRWRAGTSRRSWRRRSRR